MPDTRAIAQFERRLLELGCPLRRLREKVRELAEHHEDLKQAAREDGLSEQEAAGRADAQLGDPVLLAENAVGLLRQASWWARHPILGFGLLPLLGFIPAWVACVMLLWGFCWLLGCLFGPAYTIDSQLAGVFGDDPSLFHGVVLPANAAATVAAVLVMALVFCWLARRCAAGSKWMLVWIWVALAAVELRGHSAAGGRGHASVAETTPKAIEMGPHAAAPNAPPKRAAPKPLPHAHLLGRDHLDIIPD